MPDPAIVFLVHLGATLFMTGLIWFVQVVHYPLFRSVGREGFASYAREHSQQTTWVVAPAMLVEAITGLLIVVWPPEGAARGLLLAAIVVLALIWLSTAFVQVPRHQKLASGFDEDVHRTLVLTNLIRTIGWSVRSVLLLVVAAGLIDRGMEAL